MLGIGNVVLITNVCPCVCVRALISQRSRMSTRAYRFFSVDNCNVRSGSRAVHAVPTPPGENSRLGYAVYCFHQASKCIAAIVRHAGATMDQMIVTQLMSRQAYPKPASGPTGHGVAAHASNGAAASAGGTGTDPRDT